MDKTLRVICMVIFVLLFNILSWIFLRDMFDEMYTFIIQPLFWMLIAIYSHFYIFSSKNHVFEYRKYLMLLFLTGALFYIVIYFVLGILISGFSNNPYDNSLYGIFYNVWSIGFIIVTQEILRSSILNCKTKFNEKILNILVILFFVAISINFRVLETSLSDIGGTIKYVISIFFPLLLVNILFTLTARKAGPFPAIIYFLGINFAIWSAPILPNHEWLISTLLYVLVPFITYIAFDNYYRKKEFRVSRGELEKTDPKHFIVQLIILIFAVLFFIGILPYYPMNVLTKSMYPEINAGDVVVMKRIDINDVKVGDIVHFRKEDYTVMHRVVRIKILDGKILLNTKGDNNKSEDKLITTEENFLGKAVINIPKIGLPNLWIREITNGVDSSNQENN